MAPEQRISADNAELAVEEYDLACSRLAWAVAAGQLTNINQQAAVDWHRAECDAARAVLDRFQTHGSTVRRPA